MNHYREISIAINKAMQQYVDLHCPTAGDERRDLCIDIGKALVTQGGVFIGNAIGINDPEAGLKPAKDCLNRYQEIAESMHG